MLLSYEIGNVLGDIFYVGRFVNKGFKQQVLVIRDPFLLDIFMFLEHLTLLCDQVHDEIVVSLLDRISVEELSIALPLLKPLNSCFLPPQNFLLIPPFLQLLFE